ncbi:unnamed protein product [Schistosoma turkestanicum]|nr:unnamed protein product [Schistosoma turkestanicum]
MTFNFNSIRQIGYYTPTYSNSPNIKRNQHLLSHYQSESHGLNCFSSLHLTHDHGHTILNTVDMNLNNYNHKLNRRNLPNNNNHIHNNNNRVRINHTLDGKTQIIHETPSRTRQYWLDRRKLPSTNRIDNNDKYDFNMNTDNTMISNKLTSIKTNRSMSNDQFQTASSTKMTTKTYPNKAEWKSLGVKLNSPFVDKTCKKNKLNTDMHLFELTENEFILLELDPSVNFLNSNIKTDEIKGVDNKILSNFNKKTEQHGTLSICQPIENKTDQAILSSSMNSKIQNTGQFQHNEHSHPDQLDYDNQRK